MGHKSLILVAALLLVMVSGAVSVYAYDASNENRIAEGVTVAGVAVGGMDVEAARAKVQRQVAAPLDRPLIVRRGKKRFTLSAEDAQVNADVGGMIDEALRRSREGTIFSRVLRDATGGEADVKVSPRITYSKPAIAALVGRVQKGVDRPARDADISFPSFEQIPEQDGVKVRTGRLQAKVDAAMTRAGDRTLRIPTKTIKPEVTRDELAEKYPVVLVADRASFKLRLYRNLELEKEYTVAVGAVGFDTPAGLYHIQNKAVDPAWNVPDSDWAGSLAGTVVPGGSAENPLKERWLGIYDGAGIHGTDDVASLGTAASHGCIRMAIPDVIELYDQVEVQTPIYIA
ncbi:MAG: L,D-transpeptidase/peptidoglycan binding protein [Actinomycetota bacterium]|nr:L,D-transpeptidase/peptidoglycan binding protein [Actinomycetota bacterium]